MTDKHKELAFVHVAMMELGDCQTSLAFVCTQGIRDDNRARRGGVVYSLRKIAHRLQHGSLDGWDAPMPEPTAAFADPKVVAIINKIDAPEVVHDPMDIPLPALPPPAPRTSTETA